MKSKYINIVLKLMCYYRTLILWNGWKHHPKPTDIEAAISEIMENHSGTLNVLFPDEKIALSEGFFCWKGTD